MGCASNPLLRRYGPCAYSRYALRPDASQQRIGDATRARIGQSEVPLQEIGRFDAEFLLEFFSGEVGAYFYNRGLHDAQAILSAKLDDLNDSISLLEKPTAFRR